MPEEKSLENRIECPSCKEISLVCKYNGDLGAGPGYYDDYEAFCRSCSYTDRKSVYGGESAWDNWYTSCPFCGSGAIDHPSVFSQNQNP